MPNATAKPRRPLQAKQGRRAPIRDAEDKEIEQLYEAFRRGNAKLIDLRGEARHLPDSLSSFLVELIGLLNEGRSVMIVQNQAKLTTIEAASLLGVSRQFLVNLLEQGDIPYHMVGTHRRIYMQDLFRYKAKRDQHRHKVIRELAQRAAKEGLYDRKPSSIDED